MLCCFTTQEKFDSFELVEDFGPVESQETQGDSTFSGKSLKDCSVHTVHEL